MKGTMKRIFGLITAAAIILCFNIPVVAKQSNGFVYDDIGTQARITDYVGSESNVVIPSSLDGRIVTEIGSSAFADKTSIKSIELPETLKTIAQDAFRNCSSLQSVTIPSTVTTISEYAFSGCISLTEVTIISALTSIGHYAFESCTSLESIRIPSTKIGFGAFKNCTSLGQIEFLQPVQSLGREAFHGTAWYNSQPKGLLTVGTAVYLYNGDSTSVVIPDGIRTIADYAFYDTDVSDVVIPDGMYYIGNNAFGNCQRLNSLSLPESVVSVGLKAIGYNENTPDSEFIIYCYDGSEAQQWGIGNNLKTEIIDDCTHLFNDWQTTSSPDCTHQGKEMHRCVKCNYSESRAIEPNGHSWSGWVVISELSCTTDSIKRKTCTSCGITEDDVIVTSGHSWGEWEFLLEATCIKAGERKHTCSDCGATESVIVEPTGHSWKIDETTDSYGWIVQTMPGCIIDGVQSRVCSNCEETEVLPIQAIGHKADEWVVVKDPTAVTVGQKQGTCLVCGAMFTEDIPVLSEEMPDNITMLTLVQNATISFDSSRKCILGVDYNTTVADVLLQFEYPGHILVRTINLEEKGNDEIIGTGCILVLVRFNSETQEYEAIDAACVIIKGDVNGDGKLTAADARLALQASSKIVTLNAPGLLAADLNKDGAVTAIEARQILRVSSKIDTFE